ncbi:MAG: hypothetical protein DCC75_06530 [Proteobacteria bacterium]|nr:MAG: hypothetical protein DCC75_06530 [Pseudomonadota bacterium]
MIDRYGPYLVCAAAFLVPLKLSLSYIVIFPLLVLWLLEGRSSVLNDIRALSRLYLPYLVFLLSALLSLVMGLDPARSLRYLSSLLFFSFLVPAIYRCTPQGAELRVLLALSAGQTLAALHSCLQALHPDIPGIFLGAVTESGQLALTIPMTLGLVMALRRNHLAPPDIRNKALKFLYIAVPILVLALLFNLKRGPWLGVLAGACVFFVLHSRKFILPAILLACVVSAALEPVRSRLLDAPKHFYIPGGRKVIWEVGTELFSKYPLGIGLGNSPILRNFATEIPPELKHFHSNPINIVVENGWISLMLFYWWIFCLLKAAWRRSADSGSFIPASAIGCSILSWQVAGLFEYNFGDSEVRFVAFILIAQLAAFGRARVSQTPAS